MRLDSPDLMPQVLRMFRHGFDTAAMSDLLEIKEATIERVLHAALAGDQKAKGMLKMESPGVQEDETKS